METSNIFLQNSIRSSRATAGFSISQFRIVLLKPANHNVLRFAAHCAFSFSDERMSLEIEYLVSFLVIFLQHGFQRFATGYIPLSSDIFQRLSKLVFSFDRSVDLQCKFTEGSLHAGLTYFANSILIQY